MIKKMWALFHNGKIDISEEKFKESKPVWVTDRDPFKNVREIFDTFKDNGDDCIYCNQLIDALEKDLKNTEGAE